MYKFYALKFKIASNLNSMMLPYGLPAPIHKTYLSFDLLCQWNMILHF